jgi:serine/threonine protein kinase
MCDKTHWVIPPEMIQVDETRVLGKGKYGNVYLGNWLGTPVAIKHFEEHLPLEIKKMIQREFSTMTRIHHPHVCQLLGYTEEPFQIVMEHFVNGNLREYIDRKPPTLVERVGFMVDILRALVYLHSRKPEQVIHRDLKPENLLVSKSGKVKIADFGLSKILISDQTLYSDGYRVGTNRYMAPEMRYGELYNEKIDIWSLGVITRDIFNDMPIPPEINETISLMLETNYKRRPSAEKLLDFFLAYHKKVLNERPKTSCCGIYKTTL